MRHTAIVALLCLILMTSTVAVTPPSPTDAQTSTGPIEGVARCGDHNVVRWHPLVKKDAAGNITCTYGHEHHADPNSVNDIFGQPGEWWGGPGNAISYPWQTFNATTGAKENAAKHEGYKWYVERDKPCKPAGGQPGCLRAWRVEVHSMGHASDANARYHSYSMEALVEYNGVQGIVRHGGWLDFGHLSLNAGGGQVCPGIPADPPTFPCGHENHRETGARNVPDPYTDADRAGDGWYANHLGSSLTTTIEPWGPINYENPTEQLFYTALPNMNNSKSNLGNMVISFFPAGIRDWQIPGPFKFGGYTNQHGQRIDGCTASGPKASDPSVICVRMSVEGYNGSAGVPNVVYQWNFTTQGDMQIPEWDVKASTGKSLISFPN